MLYSAVFLTWGPFKSMLEVVDLACERGERRLFNGLSFALGAGELLYVHGVNGSGKTSLLRTLCGLTWPAAGEVRWNGTEIRRIGDEYRGRMMYVGHLNGIKDELTAFENLRVNGRMRGVAGEERALEALSRMELTGCAELPGKVLSQGQRRRLSLARLLLDDSALWILDEPFNALDVKSVGRVQTILGEHLDRGGLVVLTTHQEVEITSRRARHVHLGE